ncbi:hypothetical protein B0H10DRAFT_2070966 [Mycena sp. CBHHK59/15]|nr:hypothetical protein B0H10DRAFT_2070966 [Mycena sp. CBHHK59/15]
MCTPPRRHQPMRRLAALWLPRPPSQNISYSPYASQRAPSPSARPSAPSPHPRHDPPPARGAPCAPVPCGVVHDLRIAAPLSRPRAHTPLCILPPRRPRMRSTLRARPPPRLGRDAKGDVRLYVGREGIGTRLWRRPTSGVNMRTEGTVRLVSIRTRQPSSLARWFPRSRVGALHASQEPLLHAHVDPPPFLVRHATLECAPFTRTVLRVPGRRRGTRALRGRIWILMRPRPAAGRAPFGTGPPPPPTPPLPPSPPPSTAALRAQHHSTSIATLRTKARSEPKRSTTRTMTRGPCTPRVIVGSSPLPLVVLELFVVVGM